MTIKILADVSIPNAAEVFTAPFSLTYYHHEDEIADLLVDQAILLCRSTFKITRQLLKNAKLDFIATASSGTDHIDKDFLQQHRITLLNAKGANASAVSDYVLASLAYLDKYQLLNGRLVGIIGVGKVGSQVAQQLKAMNYEVICYDPFREKKDTDYQYQPLATLTACDVICVHANLHDTPPYPSKNLISADFLTQLKPKTILINAARGGIVNEVDLCALKHPLIYCTDVYENEPHIRPDVVDFATLCTPHIAGHTLEAKKNVIKMLHAQLCHHYHLPCTSFLLESAQKIAFPPIKTQVWSDYILSLFNPGEDTTVLKQAKNKTEAFLKQRAAHQRHDFCYYEQDKE